MKDYFGQIEPKQPKKAEGSNEIFKEPEVLEIVGNKVYFYSDINRTNIMKLNKTLSELDGQHVAAKINADDDEYRKIFLYIQSYGGSIFSGLAAMDQIDLVKSPVITVVDGVCASAATFISVKGKKRLIKPNSFMLIHQLSSIMWGKYSEFEDEMKNMKKLMDIIKDVYLKYTKVPSNKLDEILKHDLYFDAKQCLRYGLVDDIIK